MSQLGLDLADLETCDALTPKTWAEYVNKYKNIYFNIKLYWKQKNFYYTEARFHTGQCVSNIIPQ